MTHTHKPTHGSNTHDVTKPIHRPSTPPLPNISTSSNDNTSLSALTALSPLEGRYAARVEPLRPYLSEYGLLYYRLYVEIEWLCFLATQSTAIPELAQLNHTDLETARELYRQFNTDTALQIKSIEATTNHDVKAVEYYIRDALNQHAAWRPHLSFIHFACTSEDINNLAYALMLRGTMTHVITPTLREVMQTLRDLSASLATTPMLSRTHGQAASPTTLGKELVNWLMRLDDQWERLNAVPMSAKLNGAVGNYNAHLISYPDVDWIRLSHEFITQLELHWTPYTTQIEPHDHLVQLLNQLNHFNHILIDGCQDIWLYISQGYFKQRRQENEVGSSTMPHKVNPIDFENAEGNLGIANSLATFMARKLPISRLQRDLSDSTVQRNLGVIFGHSLIAYHAIHRGLKKLAVNPNALAHDLDVHWAVLAEAIQTVMRREGITDAYEQLKTLTRGEAIDEAGIHTILEQLTLSPDAKARLAQLTPARYLGAAVSLTEHAIARYDQRHTADQQ